MSRGLRILGAGSALAGVFVLVTLLRSPEPVSTQPDAQLSADANQSRKKIEDSLPAGLAAPPVGRSEAVSLGAASTSAPLPARDRVPSVTPPAVSMPQVAEDVQIASPEVAGQIAEAERQMASQGKDPLRSPAMETRIFSEIAQKALGLEITYLQADCRITLCRVQLTLPKTFLEKKFGDVPRNAVWTGREPVGFFVNALDLEWRYTTAFGGLDRYGAPVVLGYVTMPLPSLQP